MDNILLTIKYFDMFDYPLKSEEVWQWLFNQQINKSNNQNIKNIKEEFNRELEKFVKNKLIQEKNGYYFLPGRSDIINLRQARERSSLKKIKKAQRVVRLLGFIPGVKMIAICSNLGYLNAEKEADIDLFIVAQKGKIWSVRFWCVLLMMFFGQRPSKRKQEDKICLSYFVDEDNLDLGATKVGEIDVHLVYLLAQYLPIYNEDSVWQTYIKENSWIKRYLPNFEYGQAVERFIIKSRWVWLKELINRTAFDFEEKLYKKIQLKLMAPELKKMMNKGDNKVIINDKMLKLHTNDKRSEYNRVIFRHFSF